MATIIKQSHLKLSTTRLWEIQGEILGYGGDDTQYCADWAFTRKEAETIKKQFEDEGYDVEIYEQNIGSIMDARLQNLLDKN